MRRWEWTWLLAISIATLVAGPARAQELRGFVILEGGPGYLTNAYLDPFFASWAPGLDAATLGAGGTGILEWSDDRTTASAVAGARWMGFGEDTVSAWRSGVLSGSVERRLGDGLAVAVRGGFSELRRPEARTTLSGHGALRWTVSPRVRLSVGPAVGRTRFVTRVADGVSSIPPSPGPAAEEETRGTAVSYLMSATLEAWPGTRWRLGGEAYAARTDAEDLGLEYRGGGGAVRLTRWTRDGISLTLGAGAEGFGYRAALGGEAGAEVPEDEMLLRGEVEIGWPLAERIELRARLAGLSRPGGSDGRELDVQAGVGLRVTLGGSLSSARRERLWSRAADGGGMRIRVRYDGEGRLYLVGDFNDWGDPGLPLAEREPGVHTATLRLDGGSYRYRVRVVEDGEERWLELPAGAATEDDGFGGRNGVVVVPGHEDER